MSNTKTLSDLNRLNVNLKESQVDTVVPEHFKEQYPQLVEFLKAYYEYIDGEGGIAHDLKNIFSSEVDSGSLDVKIFFRIYYSKKDHRDLVQSNFLLQDLPISNCLSSIKLKALTCLLTSF